MAGGYSVAELDQIDQLVAEIAEMKRNIRELSMPTGLEIADALNVIGSPTTGHSTTTGYALTSSTLELTRLTFTVPAGVTRALVLATANTSVANQHNSLLDILRGYININGTQIGTPGPVMIDPLHVANINSSGTRVLTGLSEGNTFYTSIVAYNDFNRTGAASATNNVCNLDAAVIFLP